jgi:membrane protein
MPQPKAKTVHPAIRRVLRLMHEEIWHHSVIGERSWRGRFFALLRVGSVTITGIFKNRIFSQAAALGYSSLMSLGPIISLAIIISAYISQPQSEKFATDTLNSLISFIAPSTAAAGNLTATTPNAKLNDSLVNVLNHLVSSARSRTVGALGLFILVFISIQMIITIENNFNSIWGVRRGRKLIRRILFYFTVFCLGVLAVFTSGTLMSERTLARTIRHLPWGLNVLGSYGLLPHLLAFTLLSLLLTFFYKFIPNTKVRWRPALLGGAIVALFLILNNYLSFLYVSKVLNAQSLYGSVGILPILMFGLYVFWLLLLLGGQLTYAVQNASIITEDRLWAQVSPRTRRLLSLAAFLQIARAFVRRQPGPTSEELSKILRVPANLLNEGLTRLTDLHMIAAVDGASEHGKVEQRFQPARPLPQLTLGEFHHCFDVFGNTDGDETLKDSDAVLPHYLKALAHFEHGPALHRNFADLMNDDTPAAAPAT